MSQDTYRVPKTAYTSEDLSIAVNVANWATQEMHQEDKQAEVEKGFNLSLKLCPSLLSTCVNMSAWLNGRGRFAESQAIIHRGLALSPDEYRLHYNMGVSLQTSDAPRAIFHYKTAIASIDANDPRRPLFVYDLAITLLKLGRTDEGRPLWRRRWDNLKFDSSRRLAPPAHKLKRYRAHAGAVAWQDPPKDSFPFSLWNFQAVPGLLIWGEQGIGDELFGAFFLRDKFFRRAEKIMLEADPRLVRFFQHNLDPEHILVIPRKWPQPLPKNLVQLPGCDTWIPFKAAPSDGNRLFSSNIDYPPLRRPTIGLSFFSRKPEPKRSFGFSLEQLEPARRLLPFFNVRILQYGVDHPMAEALLKMGFEIDMSYDKVRDIERFAAEVSACSQVISVSNLTVVLCSMLGVPCHALLKPRQTDWKYRWGKAESPWLPGVRTYWPQENWSWDRQLNCAVDQILGAMP